MFVLERINSNGYSEHYCAKISTWAGRSPIEIALSRNTWRTLAKSEQWNPQSYVLQNEHGVTVVVAVTDRARADLPYKLQPTN